MPALANRGTQALDLALDPGEGSVLRVETTINNAAGFKTYRTPEGKPLAPLGWHCMRKGALASVENTTSLGPTNRTAPADPHGTMAGGLARSILMRPPMRCCSR
jgi:hypothetical protein